MPDETLGRILGEAIDQNLIGPSPAINPDYDAGVPMPVSFIRLRVRTDRGLGLVLRVRKDAKRPFLVQIDGQERPYWPLIGKVQPIGFSKKTGPDQQA